MRVEYLACGTTGRQDWRLLLGTKIAGPSPTETAGLLWVETMD